MSRPDPAEDYATSLGRFCDALLAADEMLGAYSNNYLGGHSRALASTYPLVRDLLGPAIFAILARVYVEHYPSREWDLNLYGDAFSELVGAQEQGAKAAAHPWRQLSALARMEYTMVQLYYARDSLWGRADPVSLDAVTGRVPAVWTAELQRLHPGAVMDHSLDLGRRLWLWRAHTRVRLSNHCPGDGRAHGEAP